MSVCFGLGDRILSAMLFLLSYLLLISLSTGLLAKNFVLFGWLGSRLFYFFSPYLMTSFLVPFFIGLGDFF